MKPSAPIPTKPPAIGIRRPIVIASRLPATLVTSSAATSAEMIRSRSGSCSGAVASAIGGAGSLRFLTSVLTASSPRMQVRIALRTRGSSRS